MITPEYRVMHPVRADLSRLPLPAWSQEKHNGVGGLVDPRAGLVSKEGRPIANRDAREILSVRALWGVHGELIAPGGFEEAHSVFATSSGLPSGWRFMAFDLAGSSMPFPDRLAAVRRAVASLGAQDVVQVSPAVSHRSVESIQARLDEVVSLGGEGLVIHCGAWGYREGKASATRCESVKLKPEAEAEAEIMGVRPRLDDPTLAGAFELRLGAVEFAAPLAVTRAQAARLMTQRANLPGRLATYRHAGFTPRGVPIAARVIGVRRDLAA